MKVSYRWLQKYFDAPLPKPEAIAGALTFHAFELESVEQVGEDTVFDVKVTPNRGHDALSHRGIAKELSAILEIPLAHDPLQEELRLTPLSKKLSITIESPDACPSYSAAVVKGVKVGPSPRWLKARLESVGQRSINNVVDAMNFVMFNLGQPLHAFDLEKLEEKNGKRSIFVRFSLQGESIETLDGVTRELSQTTLLIADGVANRALGIAGIKGGKTAEIGEKTTSLIIESATFHGPSIRKTAQALKLRTDASSRFEHELSPALAPYALQSAVELARKVAGGELEGYTDSYPKPRVQTDVSVSLDHINRILGLSLRLEDVESIFARLGFVYRRDGQHFIVSPPFERLDLELPEDLIEEVGRIYGYEHVPTVAPEKKRPDVLNKRFFYADRVRQLLSEDGFSEVLTSSFRNAGDIVMENALAVGKDHLRANLRENMGEALGRNSYNQDLLGLSLVKVFEIGAVFTSREEHFALALGVRSHDPKRQKKADEEARAAVASLERKLGVPIPADIEMGIAETNFDKLVAALPDPSAYEVRPRTPKVRYQPFSPYPFVLRDIALWTPPGTESSAVEDVLRKEGGILLVRASLFDTFEKGGKISYAFRLVFQAGDRTLTDEEVTSLMGEVAKALVSKGFEVR